jgi:hypothetical protein
MEWSTNPPTESGYYWARSRERYTTEKTEEVIALVLVEIQDGKLTVLEFGTEITCNPADYTHWQPADLVEPSSPLTDEENAAEAAVSQAAFDEDQRRAYASWQKHYGGIDQDS